jgi:hypothetical protein
MLPISRDSIPGTVQLLCQAIIPIYIGDIFGNGGKIKKDYNNKRDRLTRLDLPENPIDG